MPWTLTTPYGATHTPNATRFLTDYMFKEKTQELHVEVELRSGGGTDVLYAKAELVIRNGTCDRLTRNDAPLPGTVAHDPSRFFTKDQRDVPTGYTDAVAAYRAATPNNTNGRRAAMEQHMAAAGHWVAPGLAGAP